MSTILFKNQTTAEVPENIADNIAEIMKEGVEKGRLFKYGGKYTLTIINLSEIAAIYNEPVINP